MYRPPGIPAQLPFLLVFLAVTACGSGGETPVAASDCVECHREATPGIVTDWELSTHSTNGVDCAM